MKIKTNKINAVRTIKTLDGHTEGEPLRIVVSGYPEIKGAIMLENRQYVNENFDQFRQFLMYEPRGHADMYGAIITEPCSQDAMFGILFMHNEGYSSMCGHAIIIESIVGGKMTVEITQQCQYYDKAAVIPRVSGQAYITGIHQFVLTPGDIFENGFLLR